MRNYMIDETSLKILALLQENARLSYTEIGKEIGMSSSSVKERVQKLEENEIITQYSIKINHGKIGYPITAIVLLSCSGAYTQKEQVIIDMLSLHHQVVEVLRVTGRTDIIIKLCVRTMEECKEITDKWECRYYSHCFWDLETKKCKENFGQKCGNDAQIEHCKNFNINSNLFNLIF